MSAIRNFALTLILILGFFITNAHADATKCRYDTNGKIANLVSDTDSSCFAQGTTKIMTVYKVYLCKSKPTAPTSSSTSDYTSKCSILLSNTSGDPLIMGQGEVKKIPGTITPLQTLTNGKTATFSYLVAESEPQSIARATVNFGTARTAVDGSTGAVCWTTDATIYSYDSVPTSGASCGSSAPASPGVITVRTNSFAVGGATMSYESGGGGNYLVDSSYKLSSATTSGNMGTVSKQIDIVPLSVTFNQKSSGLKVSFDLTTGAWIVNNMSGGSQKTWIQPGGNAVSFAVCSEGGCR